jgi:hypothetical protein
MHWGLLVFLLLSIALTITLGHVELSESGMLAVFGSLLMAIVLLVRRRHAGLLHRD